MSVIERVKLTSAAKNQLIALKRKTGIEHNNVLCRHALCLSLANASIPPEETFNFAGGLEIDWRTFTGGNEAVYHNLIVVRLLRDQIQPTPNLVRQALLLHVHRGLSYLASRREDELLTELASSLV
ncbi:DNA sulfur modification protein DndE [Burkholderia contaminans]|uniref:DNA sulfur modification protein DndE n=1 Tax=Burkholderia contaminans TaxID=488447 RepID=UPI002416C4F7|nr:DNA sulfur modification protein DndE [Burkholderia contaminans]WFN09433.1 DNA sulfur modification protein DndE [Burkholderia contaminans]